jgi:hypothetical protein
MTLQSENTIRVDEKSHAEAETRLKKAGDLLVEPDKTTTFEDRRAAYQELDRDIEALKARRLALGDAVKQVAAVRASLFSDGDKVRVANWRMISEFSWRI